MSDKGIVAKIDALTRKARQLSLKEKFEESIVEYQKCIDLLPEPKRDSKFAVMIFSGIGECHFLQKKWEDALKFYGEAVMSKGGLGEPLIHLRLGEIRYELGDTQKAKDELLRAYMGGGEFIFDGEDSKYFKVISSIIVGGN